MGNFINSIEKFSPSYFAFVMATGIISTASDLQQYPVISTVLFWISNIAFLTLSLFLAVKLIFFFPSLVADLTSHEKGAGFLTVVAASCVLGNGYAQAKGAYGVAMALWYFGILMWVIITFSFLSGIILKKEKPSPEAGLNGTYFLLVVSTQSISILAVALAPHLTWPVTSTLFFSLMAFLLGLMLYLMIAPLVTYRLFFYPMKEEEVVPSYWINMGAAAITTLAGVMLGKSIRTDLQLANFFTFVHTSSLLFWCIAGFWAPLIFIMEIWRYIIKGSPLKYTPEFWSMVFPLGMYTVCTWRLSETVSFPLLQAVSRGFIYVAWATWVSTFLGMLFHLIKGSRTSEK